MDKSVVKAFTLLELLSGSEDAIGITALAEMSELGKSNVHRLLQTLTELGYVQQDDHSAYRPTLKTWELGSQVISRLSVRSVARPFMEQLSRLTNEAVHLSERDGFDVLYIDKIESREPVRAYTQLGGRAPAYCTATGKAMLAFAGDEEIAECLGAAQQFTPKTITSADRFRLEAERIRTTGYSINRGEWRADIIGLGAPIADANGTIAAAIGLSAPASRVSLEELETVGPRVIGFAAEVSLALGCSPRQWAELGTGLSGPTPNTRSTA